MKAKPKTDSNHRQMRQTLTILKLLSRGPQTAAALTHTLDLHVRTVDRIMRALAGDLGADILHQRSVPGSGRPPSWTLTDSKRTLLEEFFTTNAR